MELINSAFCEEVKKIVNDAVKFIRNERFNFNESAVEYKGTNDLVSYVDKTAEKILVEKLLLIIPEAGFIAE